MKRIHYNIDRLYVDMVASVNRKSFRPSPIAFVLPPRSLPVRHRRLTHPRQHGRREG